jgi:hypothetical protein
MTLVFRGAVFAGVAEEAGRILPEAASPRKVPCGPGQLDDQRRAG